MMCDPRDRNENVSVKIKSFALRALHIFSKNKKGAWASQAITIDLHVYVSIIITQRHLLKSLEIGLVLLKLLLLQPSYLMY